MVSIKGIYCSTGVNCNPYETKTLLDILDYREEFQSWVMEERQGGKSSSSTAPGTKEDSTITSTIDVVRKLRWLSQSYRKALSTCLLSSKIDHDFDDNEDDAKELLKCMSAIMQLSEIFLVPYPISTSTVISDDVITEDEEDIKADITAASTEKTISLPGSLTANTIRYLRAHHLPNKWHTLQQMSSTTTPDDEDESKLRYLLEDMLSSDQPEQWTGSTTTTDETSSLYWKLIQSLVKRGCLKDAWYVLKHHSYYSNNTSYSTTVNHHHHLRQGFLYLRAILLSAPIPGGRTDTLDDILPLKMTEGEQEEQYNTSLPTKIQDEHDEEEEEASILTNIPSNAHEGWGCTTTTTTAPSQSMSNHNNTYTDDSNCNDGAGTASGIRMSKSYYTLWSNLITTAYTATTPNGPLSALLQHIPELRWAVLDIISGQFISTSTYSTSSSSYNYFDGWAEALCAELLYKHPMIRPEDIPIRAQATMKAYSTSSFTSMEEMEQGGDNFINHIVLSIMKKDAGSAIDALHKFGGGSSAGMYFLSFLLHSFFFFLKKKRNLAIPFFFLFTFFIFSDTLPNPSFGNPALPSTLTALFCDLLVLAGCIPKKIKLSHKLDDNTSPESSNIILDLRKELFLLAAWACEACFRAMDDEDDGVGIQCAARLLSLEGSVQARCALYDLLGRRMPTSDAEAKSWLTIVSSTISSFKEEEDMSEVGSTIALSRAQYYLAQSRPGGAAYWMLRGAEVESIRRRTLPEKCATAISSCTRGLATVKLGALCIETASNILKSLSTKLVTKAAAPTLTKNVFTAREIINSIGEDDALSTSLDSISMMAFSLLNNVSDLATALLQENYAEVASKIYSCLVDRPTDGTVMLPLAHPGLWIFFLQLAFNILKLEEHSMREQLNPSFDVNGIHTLMERLMLLESSVHAGALIQPQLGTGAFVQNNTSLVDEVDGTTMMQQQTLDNVDIPFSVPEMRLLLAKGLMRAFLKENSQRKVAAEAEMEWKYKEESSHYAPPLLGGLEESIDLFLGPPPCSI